MDGFKYGTPCASTYTIRNISTANVIIAESMTRSITISDPGVLVYAFNLSFHVTSLLLIILPPLQKCYTEVQKKDKYEENYAGCNQCFSVKSGCISHLNYNICCQCSDSSEDSFRHSRLITSHHDHCHRLSDRTPDSKNNSCHYSGFGCR